MHKIVSKRCLATDTYLFEVEAPLVAKSRKAGQFFILMLDTDKGERIPLSICGGDRKRGTIKFVVQAIGRTTRELVALNAGDSIPAILGPLGTPAHIEKFDGECVCIGGGYGTGAIIPFCDELRAAGNKVTGIVGARRKDLLIMVDELKAVCDEVIITTDDGSAGAKGFVIDALRKIIESGRKVGVVEAIGPVPMMKAVSEMTRPLKIKTIVSLNAIMLDGTGMCGGCRVTAGGKTQFACFEGPDFDGHNVNFEELVNRQKLYTPQEKIALERYEKKSMAPDNHKIKVPIYNTPLALPDEITLSDLPTIPNKVRMKIPRQPMPKQPAEERIKNFEEVAQGLTEELSALESARCLQCKDAKCVKGCPVCVDIPAFLKLLRENDYTGAARKVFETNSLPAICGRVCPQEEQCESLCTTGKKVTPVAIGRLERFAADWAWAHNGDGIFQKPQPNGFKVACVGSGPSSLTCAGDLAKLGYDVTVFEALHKVGGVLIYGIPSFRLPRSVIRQEVSNLEKLGVKFVTNCLVGRTFSIDQLLKEEGFNAVFIGTGAGLPNLIGCEGENLKGIYTANEYLMRINLMNANMFPEHDTPIAVGKKVAVIGAGNTAMDGARVSLRLGSETSIVYRRGKEDAPARKEELENAEEEGVKCYWLTAPVKFIGNESGWVKKMVATKMEYFGEPDPNDKLKRRKVRAIPGSEFEIEVDTVVNALGFGVNPLIASTTKDIKTSKRGPIVADEETGMTSKEGVFAGGDVITGGATVILAMGQGKKAAKGIDQYIKTRFAVPTTSNA